MLSVYTLLGVCQQSEAQRASDCGNTAREVGLEPDQVVFRQPCFLTEFHKGLLFRGSSGLEISSDAMPASAVMPDGLAAPKERNPVPSLDDHSHYRTGPEFCGRKTLSAFG